MAATTTSSFLEGLAAGFARQNISGAIREGRKIDEARLAQKQFADDVQNFQFSIGDSPSAKKSFTEMQKRNPGWNRDKKVFREFVANYYTLNDTMAGIDKLAQKGIFGPNPDPIVKLLQKQAINDPEGVGKTLVMQAFNYQAGVEKSALADQAAQQKKQAAEDKQAKVDQVAGLAFRASQSGSPEQFISELRDVPDAVKSEALQEAFRIVSGRPKGGQSVKPEELLTGDQLVKARNETDPEAIIVEGNRIGKTDPAAGEAYKVIASQNVLTKEGQADISNEVRAKQAAVKSTVAQITEASGENPTDDQINTFLRDNADELNKFGIGPAEVRVGINDQNALLASERQAKVVRKQRSSNFMDQLTKIGVDMGSFSSTATGNNTTQFDPDKIKKVRVFEGDPGAKANGLVALPNGSFVTFTESTKGLHGTAAPDINGNVFRVRMQRTARGDLEPVLDAKGNMIQIPMESQMDTAKQIFLDADVKKVQAFYDFTTAESENPNKIVFELAKRLRDDLMKVKNSMITTDEKEALSSRRIKVGNPETNEGVLIMQLNGLLQSLKETDFDKRLKGNPFGFTVLESDEKNENLRTGAEAYLKYQGLKDKYILNRAGLYLKK